MSCRFDWFISPLTAKYSVFYERNLVLQLAIWVEGPPAKEKFHLYKEKIGNVEYF